MIEENGVLKGMNMVFEQSAGGHMIADVMRGMLILMLVIVFCCICYNVIRSLGR